MDPFEKNDFNKNSAFKPWSRHQNCADNRSADVELIQAVRQQYMLIQSLMAQNRRIGFELLDLRGKVDKKKTKTQEDDETHLISNEPSTVENIQELLSGSDPYF